MKNNVSSTSLKSLLDSYDRDAAANSRNKISTVGSSGASSLKSNASALASTIPQNSVVPEISASDGKSLMSAYYKPYLAEAKAAATAEKKAIAEAKAAAKKKKSSGISVSDPNEDGSKKDSDFWNQGKDNSKSNRNNKPDSNKSDDNDKEKKRGLLAEAAGAVGSLFSGAIKGLAENAANRTLKNSGDEVKEYISTPKSNQMNAAEQKQAKLDEARQSAAQSNQFLATKKQLSDSDKNVIFTRYNNFIQQGDNRNILKLLDQQKQFRNDTEMLAATNALLSNYDPAEVEQAQEYKAMYDRIPGYRVADRAANTVLGTAKTAASGAVMAKDSLQQHLDDSAVNWENEQLQANKQELENINNQIQELQAFGRAYETDEIGSIIGNTPEFTELLNRKQDLEKQISEDTVSNPVSKDTSGYQLYQSAQENLKRSDMGLSSGQKMLKGAATSAAENLALAAVNPALVLPVLSAQGAASSMGEDIANETPAGTTLAKGAAKFMAGYAINSVGVEQMLDTMGVSGARNTIASNIVQAIKSNSKLAQTNPTFYATLMGAGDNGLQSFAEFWADRAIDLASNTAQPMSMEELLSQSLSEAGSGALGGAFTGLAGSAVNAGRQAMNNTQAAQYATETTGDNLSPVGQPATDYDLLPLDETSVNDNPNTHTAAQMNSINDYKQSVDTDMINFIENVRSGNYTEPYVVSETNDRMRSAMMELTGMDKVGDVVVLDKNGVKHIDKRHGENGEHDKTMSKTEDMARAAYVLQNFDNAYLSKDKAEGYVTRNGKLAPIVIFDKKIDGTHIVVEAVSDSKKGRNFIVSEYLSKNGVDKQKIARALPSSMDAGNTDPRATPEALASATLANQSLPQEAAPVNEDLLTYGLLDDQPGNDTEMAQPASDEYDLLLPEQPAATGDGGYGANTVGAAESKFDNTPGDIVHSQSNSIQQALKDGGATPGEAEMLTDNFSHERISLGKQTERANQIINEVGIPSLVNEYADIVSKGEMLNDEQSDTAVVAIEQLQKSIKDSSTDETAKMEAQIMRDRLMKAVSANNTVMARALGYQGNKVKSGIDYATAAYGAIDKITDKAIEKGKVNLQQTEQKVQQVVETARDEAADGVIAKIEEQITKANTAEQEALGRLQDAKGRAKAARKSARQAEKAADRAENYAAARVAKAGDRIGAAKLQMDSPAEQLAKKVVSNSKDKVSKSSDVTSRMVQELFNLSKETAPQGNKISSQKPTIFQLLNEALFNRQAYSDTLNQAKEIVKSSVEDTGNFSDWLETNTPTTETVSKNAIVKALAQTIMETDRGAKELKKKLAFETYDDVVNEVTNYLLDKSGASEERSRYENALDSAGEYGSLEPITAEGQNAQIRLAELDQQADFIRGIVGSELSGKIAGKNGNLSEMVDKSAENVVLGLLKDGQINLREEVKRAGGDLRALQDNLTETLVSQYGVTQESAAKATQTVADVYSNLVGEAIDKNMKQMLPELYGKKAQKASPNAKSAVDKFIEIARMGQYNRSDVKELVASKYGIPGLTTEQTNRIVELGDEMQLMKEKNSKAYFDKAGEMTDIISEAMGGGTWADVITSWPYVSMLSSIGKTGGKNVVGNVTLGGMTKLKNATVKPFLEWAAHGLSGGKYERTTSNMLFNSKAQQQRSAAYEALINNYYGLLKNPSKLDTSGALINSTGTQDIVRDAQNQRKIFADKAGFIGKAAQKLADVENAVYSAQDDYGAIGTLEMFSVLPENSKIRQMAEDFMTSHYEKRAKKGKIGISGTQNQFVDAMSREMAAHGIDSYEQLMQNHELADQMAKRAAQQANEATLHDVNAFTRAVMDISSRGGIAGKALNPFAKTAGNIVVRGAEYSPFGVVEAANKAWHGDATTAIDALSKSITGTALMTLGAYAFKSGLITLKADDGDKDKYESATQGKQKYSIEIGDLLRDMGFDAPDSVTASLDSLSVGAMPFFMGAGIAEGMQDGDNAATVGTSLLSLWDPLADFTLLSGISDLIQSIQNTTDTNAAMGVTLENVLAGYIGEYIPTLAKQVGRSFSQETRKSYYSDKEDQLNRAIDFDVTGMKNWIPGFEGEDYIDPLGRTQESVGGNLLGRLAYNTLSPVTINYSRPSEVDDFLDLVYEQSKKDSVYPDMATKHATVEVWDGDEKESYRLSKEEMTTFAKTSGQATEEMLKSLQDIDGILDIGGDNIVDIQSDLYSVARNIGYLDALGDDYAGGESDEMKANMKAYDELGVDGFVDYIVGKKAFNAISKSDNPAETAELYTGVLDELTPSIVGNYMSDSYKKPYQAYVEGGVKAMAAYETASDRYSQIKDDGGKYVDAVLSLDDMSPAEQGYIYTLHSSNTAKVKYLTDYFSNQQAYKLSYWFMRYSAIEDTLKAQIKDTNIKLSEAREAWANQYISDEEERKNFIYLYNTARKDWNIS